jgi:uracil-DNA glycosylase
MVALRERMQANFDDWKADLPVEIGEPGWRTFFAACPDLNFGVIPGALQIADDASVWPGRRGAIVGGAPEGAHISRAFDGIQPATVRVVVLGQDPYPHPHQATGRAFEDGAWQMGGRPEELAVSLKFLMLSAWATQDGQAEQFRRGGWPDLIRTPGFALPAPTAYFDALSEQGVLFVNAAWTHTKTSEVNAHLTLWQPILHYLLRKLVRDAQEPLVFLLLGKKAQRTFSGSGAEAEARNAGTWGNLVTRIDLPHPIAADFLIQNPWTSVNHALQALNAGPVGWWPVH